MKKIVAMLLIAGFVATTLLGSSASALPPFKKAFEEKYPALKADAEKAGCNICHVKGAKSKKDKNAYGAILEKSTGGKVKADLDAAKDDKPAKEAIVAEATKKLIDGFTAAESEKAASGKTYGELIKAGKLPISQ